MFDSSELQAKYDNPLVIVAINSLAEAIHVQSSISGFNYRGDGCYVSENLEQLISILMNQIVCCVPREKQHTILISHGLDDLIDDLDYFWDEYCSFAKDAEIQQ